MAAQQQYLPHETQFITLERSELLTRGFANPTSLIDHLDFFNDHPRLFVHHNSKTRIQGREKSFSSPTK